MALVLLLFSSILGYASCNLVFPEDGHDWVAATSPYITYPANQTYNSDLLNLNVRFKGLIWGNIYFSMNFSLDGKDNQTIPLHSHYFGSFLHGDPEKNYWDGLVELPVLSNGSHSVTVYLEGLWETYDSASSHTQKKVDNQTVDFTVLSPIQLLTNDEVFYSAEIPLNYYSDENVSQVAFSIDNKANVTIAGNSILTHLSDGAHSINIYGYDSSGHWVGFDTATFTVAKPSTNQSSAILWVVSAAIITSVATVLFLYLRTRKSKTD
jgi:hypothetical protein